MRCLFRTSAILACGAWLLLPLAAQQTGRITGVVIDSDQAILPGAQIVLKPLGLRATTDAGGRFTFLAVPTGRYTLTVSYVGFSNYTQLLTVTSQAQRLQIVMQVASRRSSIVVKAARPYGEAEAINTERTSDNILNALPESVITSLPNANVADAAGRLPGVTLERDEGEGKYLPIRGTEPRLSKVTVDGVEIPSPENGVRQVKLDVIPADLVGSLELNETLQADQEGDAIGGSVNLVTKTAGDTPTVTLYGIGGFTPIDNTRVAHELGGTLGKRFGRSKRLGAIISGSYDYNGRGIDNVEPVPGVTSSGQFFDYNADLRQYLYDRSRYGFAGALDYKANDNLTVYLRGLMSEFLDGGLRTVYNVQDVVSNPGGTPSASDEQRIGDYLISSLILGANQVLPASNMWINWQVAAARSRMLNPQFDNFGTFNYNGPASQCQFDFSATTDPNYPQWTPACYAEAYTPANWSFGFLKTGNHGIAEKMNWSGKVDAGKNYMAGATIGTLQLGAEVQNSHQFDDSYAVDYTPNDPSGIPMALFVTDYANSNYYQGHYPAGPFLDVRAQEAFAFAHPNLFTITSTQSHDPENYGLTERIPAGYAMNALDFGRFRLTTGLRVEHTGVRTLSPDTNNSLTIPGSASYTSYLPSAALQYKMDADSDVRLAFGRGISRPIPYDMTTATFLDTSTNPNTYDIGNPDLRPEYGTDYDFLYERYLQPLGMFRAGYFYKALDSPIAQLVSKGTGQYAGFLVNQPVNIGSARVEGLEVSFQQQFTYLPGALRGLGFMGNYSYAASRAYNVAPGVRTDNPRLLRQAPNTWNLNPTFDLGRVSARVGLAYNGPNIYQYNYANVPSPPPGGITGPYGDVYEITHFQVDAQAMLKLARGFSFLVSGLNLNNAPFGFYQGSATYLIQREFYHPTYSFGVHWDLPRE
jgi:TonB-dependent receptor